MLPDMNSSDRNDDTDPPVSEAGERLLVKLEAKRAANQQLSFSTKEIGVVLGVGPTRVSQIIATELDTFLEGNRRRALADDVFDLVRDRIVAANPPEGAVKVRAPPSMFKKKQRQRTPQELAALQARERSASARSAATQRGASGRSRESDNLRELNATLAAETVRRRRDRRFVFSRTPAQVAIEAHHRRYKCFESSNIWYRSRLSIMARGRRRP
jgi:hypothetical protein